MKVGDKAPKFSELKKFLKPHDNFLVVYFYPKDDTPGCTKEACSLRDGWNELKQKGITVVGVSPDSEKSHQKFKDKHQLPFHLIPDEEKELASAFGVWQEKSMYGKKYMGIVRTTFIINTKGKITHIIDKVNTSDHAKQIMDEVA